MDALCPGNELPGYYRASLRDGPCRPGGAGTFGGPQNLRTTPEPDYSGVLVVAREGAAWKWNSRALARPGMNRR